MHHLEVVLVLKEALARCAVVLPVTRGGHVPVGRFLTLKDPGACLAFNSPVVEIVHVPVGCFLALEGPGARLTLNSPVVEIVHVLITGGLQREITFAGLALNWRCPVIQRIHVLHARTPRIEDAGALVTLIAHLGCSLERT